MKLIYKIFIALAFCGLNVGVMNAQTPIVPHLTDKSIKVEIPEYTNVSPFIRENLIQISCDNKLAYLNLKGEYVYGFDLKMQTVKNGAGLFDCAAAVQLPQEDAYQLQPAILCQQGRMLPLGKNYSKISDFCDGIAAAVKNDPNKYGESFWVYLNVAGKEVLPALHRKIGNVYSVDLHISPLREGMRAFYDITLKKWGYADKDGKVVIQPKYGVAMPFSEGLAAVCLQDGDYGAKKWGFIDKTGKEIIPCTYNMQPASFSDGFAVLRIGEDEWSSKSVFIDKTGKICSPEYDVCNSFFGGFAYVSNEYGKAMVVDKKFNVIKTLDFPTDHLTNDMSKVSEKNPFGLEFINGLAAAGYFDDVPNGNLYTNDGNILFTKDGRSTIYNFYDGKHALCRYKIDGKEIYGFINKKGEFVIYFEKKDGFNYTTPKLQNASCDLCTQTIVGDPEPPKEIPCEVCNKQSVCYDEYNCCDECNPKSKCYDICNKGSKCYNEYECCDICNPKSKCYDEYECCDKTNKNSRCWDPGECENPPCDSIVFPPPPPPPPPPPCDYCEYGSDCYSPYYAFCYPLSKCYDPNAVCNPKSICYNKMLCCLKTYGNIWCREEPCSVCDPTCKDFNPNDPKCKQTPPEEVVPPPPPPPPLCDVCTPSCKEYDLEKCLQLICSKFPSDYRCPPPISEKEPGKKIEGEKNVKQNIDSVCTANPALCNHIDSVCKADPVRCDSIVDEILKGKYSKVAPDTVSKDSVNHNYRYKLFTTKITIDKIVDYNTMFIDKDKSPKYISYKMPAAVYIAISDSAILPTPYDETAHGMIWIVTESGMPSRPTSNSAVFWSAPYTVFSLTGNEINFGGGVLLGLGKYDEDKAVSVSAQSSQAGGWLKNFMKLITDPLGLFIDDGFIADPAKPQKIVYKINDDGTMNITSSTLPIFNNLLLTPIYPKSRVVVYPGYFTYLLKHTGRKVDAESAGKVGPEFDKALRKKYEELKAKF
ncbi:MAG: WG repeat-containing protein [Paludibacter sp.]|nr:WG repeat-containing protein [Paludibacter sp.]